MTIKSLVLVNKFIFEFPDLVHMHVIVTTTLSTKWILRFCCFNLLKHTPSLQWYLHEFDFSVDNSFTWHNIQKF